MIDLRRGDCLKVLKTMKANSVHSIVTDPPYGLKFMGKKWDYDVPTKELWKECLRVLKPGGHLLAFGGTRTYHRLAVNIEDAGFEIRDQIMWIYGSGFPKSMDISKAIDKEAGAKRKVVGKLRTNVGMKGGNFSNKRETGEVDITAPETEDAKQWSGYGTALKPANEPICLARKPISEKTVAKNVLKHGTGGLNIDASRIGTDIIYQHGRSKDDFGFSTAESAGRQWSGRFPANVIFDEDAARVLDEQSGILKSGSLLPGHKRGNGTGNSLMCGGGIITGSYGGDSGGASRFFYVAKASKKDRDYGLDSFELKRGCPETFNKKNRSGNGKNRQSNNKNTHPTVKPTKLMEYLIRMITPPGGVILDPYMGSGSTGVSAVNSGFSFTGIELDKGYHDIAKRRIKNAKVRNRSRVDRNKAGGNRRKVSSRSKK